MTVQYIDGYLARTEQIERIRGWLKDRVEEPLGCSTRAKMATELLDRMKEDESTIWEAVRQDAI